MKYETIMIFNTQLNEDGITALADKFKALIAENGTIDKVEEWGKRRLAYPIEDEIEGYYLLVRFTSHPSFPAELDRVYKITDGVLRTLIVVCEEDEKAPTKSEPAPFVQAEPVAAEPAEAEAANENENA
jgi:small subunit ribosomal protein S6